MLKQLAPILMLGTTVEMLWIATVGLGPLREHSGVFVGLMLAEFALCLWAFFRLPIRDTPGLISILAFAFVFRLTVLPAPPYQSEDVYRYMWDARVSAMGYDPFRFTPDAPELHALRDSSIYPFLNSKQYLTAYPPLSQILFRFSYELFGTSILAMKAVFSAFEFGVVILAWRLIKTLGLPMQPLYLLAWNPFFIFEFSHSGHSDSAMMFFMLLSILLLHHSRKITALVSYANATLVKLHPALWFPLYLRRTGWKAALAGIAAGAVIVSIYYTPFSGLRYIRSLSLYYRLFEFNASVHYLLRFIGREVFQQAWDKLTGPFLAVILVLICAVIWWKFPVRSEIDLLHAGFWLMTADLCLSTTVHPWYLSWAALALPILPYGFMIYWTGAVFLSYLAYAYQPVYEPPWVLLVEYLPVYALMAWEIRRKGPILSSWLERRSYEKT
jgi:alpha-1,6-mannosyltransferase